MVSRVHYVIAERLDCKMRDIAKIGLGLTGLYLAFKIAVKGLVVDVSKVLFKGIDLANMTAQVQLNISIRNPLPVGVKVHDVVGEIYAQGVQVGYVNTVFDYMVAGGRTHVLPVIINLTAQGLGEALWKNIQSGNIQSLVIDFDGKLHVTNMNIAVPLELSFNYKDLV